MSLFTPGAGWVVSIATGNTDEDDEDGEWIPTESQASEASGSDTIDDDIGGEYTQIDTPMVIQYLQSLRKTIVSIYGTTKS